MGTQRVVIIGGGLAGLAATMKLAELGRLAEPARLLDLREIKHALDPAGIMNPGKLGAPVAAS